MLPSLLALVLAFLSSPLPAALAQDGGPIDFQDGIHNATSIVGVWSSGQGHVQTGPSFVNVEKREFYPPPSGGLSVAFTEDMYFEIVQYKFGSNPTKPGCPNATLTFQHGMYELHPDGKMTLNPFTPDGLVQTQSPCASKSSTLQQFNATIEISLWRIWLDKPSNNYHLHLFAFDGFPYNMLKLRSTDARSSMLPTQTILVQTPTPPRMAKRGIGKRNAAPSIRFGVVGGMLAVVGAVAVGCAMVAL